MEDPNLNEDFIGKERNFHLPELEIEKIENF